MFGYTCQRVLRAVKTLNKSITRNAGQMMGSKIEVNGVQIHYESVGSGAKPVLLLPGAIGSTRTDFSAQLDGMSGDKFRLIAWDPPGYGYSRPPERDFNNFYRNDAKLAAQLMENLGIKRYSIMGWSDGGITGFIIAAANPENVSKLVVWGAQSYVTDEDRALLLAIKDTNKWSARAKQAFINLYGEPLFVKLWTGFVEHYVKYDDICNNDLKNIVCPTLIIHGDLDPLVAKEHPDYLLKHIKNSVLHRYPEGKHNVHQKYSKEFNKLVEDFIIH